MDEQPSDVGISNREAPEQEERDRREHPPQAEEEAAQLAQDERTPSDLQTSRKSGTRASAQKESGTRHQDDGAPSTSKVQGAFGKEPE